MDVSPDVWGQLALEASQVYLTDGSTARSPFANTVIICKCTFYVLLYV